MSEEKDAVEVIQENRERVELLALLTIKSLTVFLATGFAQKEPELNERQALNEAEAFIADTIEALAQATGGDVQFLMRHLDDVRTWNRSGPDTSPPGLRLAEEPPGQD